MTETTTPRGDQDLLETAAYARRAYRRSYVDDPERAGLAVTALRSKMAYADSLTASGMDPIEADTLAQQQIEARADELDAADGNAAIRARLVAM